MIGLFLLFGGFLPKLFLDLMSPFNVWLKFFFNTGKLSSIPCVLISFSPLIFIFPYGIPTIYFPRALWSPKSFIFSLFYLPTSILRFFSWATSSECCLSLPKSLVFLTNFWLIVRHLVQSLGNPQEKYSDSTQLLQQAICQLLTGHQKEALHFLSLLYSQGMITNFYISVLSDGQ